jgi:hypothetical protein
MSHELNLAKASFKKGGVSVKQMDRQTDRHLVGEWRQADGLADRQASSGGVASGRWIGRQTGI